MSFYLKIICLVILSGLAPLSAKSQEHQQRYFILQNNTQNSLYDIFLFGSQIDSLAPGRASQEYPFVYNPITDDSMIYCISEGVRYACYLHIPDKYLKKFSYIVESIQNDVLFVGFSPLYD